MPGTSALGKRTPVGRPDDARYGNSAGNRLRRAAAAALNRNSLELPVMTTPPTITTGTATLDATLSTTYYFTASTANAAKFKYRGGIPTIFASVYYRFPTVTIGSGTGNATATQNAAGWAVEFYTDAPKVQVVILNSTSASGLAFEVDGQAVSASSTAFPSTTGTGFFLLDFTSAGGRAPRRIRVEGDIATGMRGLNVTAVDSVWAPGDLDAIKVALVGDSVTAQQGATKPNGGFAASLGKLLGWTDVRQVALGGTGWIAQGAWASTFGDSRRVADVTAIAPDLIVCTGSSNDVAQTSAAITAAVLAGLQAYRAALPKVPIVVSGIWPGINAAASNYITSEAAVLAAFTSWADPNSFFVPVISDTPGSWVTGTGHVGATAGNGNADVFVNAADTIHPSQAGHDYYAKRWAAAFRQSILPNIKT